MVKIHKYCTIVTKLTKQGQVHTPAVVTIVPRFKEHCTPLICTKVRIVLSHFFLSLCYSCPFERHHAVRRYENSRQFVTKVRWGRGSRQMGYIQNCKAFLNIINATTEPNSLHQNFLNTSKTGSASDPLGSLLLPWPAPL